MKINIQPLIFVIEDDPSYRMMLKHELEKNNFRKIKYFLNVEECLDDLDQHPDVVILDGKSDIHKSRIYMSQIKKRSRKSDIILISTTSNLLAALSVMRDGASDLIIKDDLVFKKVIRSIKDLIRTKYNRQSRLADGLVAGWTVSVAILLLLYFLL